MRLTVTNKRKGVHATVESVADALTVVGMFGHGSIVRETRRILWREGLEDCRAITNPGFAEEVILSRMAVLGLVGSGNRSGR